MKLSNFDPTGLICPVDEILLAERERRRRENPIKPHHRRQVLYLQRNVLHAVDTVGSEQLGFLTVTSNRPRSAVATLRAFDAARPEVRRELGFECVRVVDGDNHGKCHVHAIIVADFDLRAGLNESAYAEMRALSDLNRPLTSEEDQRRRDLGRSVTTNTRLKNCWVTLRRILRKHGFASRVELMPLLKEPIAAARYLAGRYCATIRRSRSQGERRRLINYTDGFPRRRDPLVTPGQIAYRHKRDAVVAALGMELSAMRGRFGKSWGWLLLRAIERVESAFGPTPELWPAVEAAKAAMEVLGRFDEWQIPTIEKWTALDDLKAAAARNAA